MSAQSRLDEAIGVILEVAEENAQAKGILEAVRKGRIDTPHNRYDPAPGFDGRLRELAREAVFEVWNRLARAATLKEIYYGIESPKVAGVIERIASDVEDHAWPGVWNAHPDKRTVDRRVNELADDSPRFWGVYDVPPCICLKAGFYQPNPYLFDDSVRHDVAKAAEIKLAGAPSQGPREGFNQPSEPSPLPPTLKEATR